MEEKKEYKITLDKFWCCRSLGETLAIHCDTEEKAKNLLTTFDKMGQKWRSGVRYTEKTDWKSYTTDTVYYNDCSYGNLDWAHVKGIPVYEFEEVDLSKYLDNNNQHEEEKGE